MKRHTSTHRVILAAMALAASVLVGMAAPAFSASGWTSVSSGESHTCGIRGGRVYCWGNDTLGQLGDGTAGGVRATPAPIKSNASDWTSVSAGVFHTCAVRAGRVACWGDDGAGQLGDGTAGGVRASPAMIKSNATDWTSVSAGSDFTCAVRSGRVACWGKDNLGQLGDGSAGATPDPTPGLIQSGATDWKSVSAGSNHACAVRSGRIACWGYDDNGQLGDGTPGAMPDPTPGLIQSGATDWRSVSAGGNHTCAVRSGRIACWGYDGNGQLGDGSATNAPDPTPGLIKSNATDWKSVSADRYHTCATRAGRVACWGDDGNGQLGDGTALDAPDPTPGFIQSSVTDWTSVSAGGTHTCALRATRAACWGEDTSGQLGDGTANPGADPVPTLVQ